MAPERITAITENEFLQLSAFIRKQCGISLGRDKKAMVVGRLGNLLARYNFPNFSEYLDYVFSDTTGEAVTVLLNKLTTNHTFFMREARHFSYLEKVVLPELVGSLNERDLRIWSAGCSTGEEPYTIAMIIDQILGPYKSCWNTRILATDISMQALETAMCAEYYEEELREMPAQWRLSYFRKLDKRNYVIDDRLKKEVVFRRFNLMDERFPFKKKFHIIFCRNVMIYFDEDTKQKLIDKFYEHTEKGGYLFIGHSENLNRINTAYTSIMPAVYRKI